MLSSMTTSLTASSPSSTPTFPFSSITFYLATVTVVALTYYLYKRANRPDWTQYGAKHVHLSQRFFFDEDFKAKFSKLLFDNGDIVGFNIGSQLRLITSNIPLLKHVLVKDFNNFVDRGEQLRSNSPFAKSLFFAKGNDWRRYKQIVSPTFTSGKLRHILKTVDLCSESLAKYFQGYAERGEIAPIKDVTARFTGELIARAAFGLNVNFIGEAQSEFFNYAQNMIPPRTGRARTIYTILNFIPNLIDLCLKLFPNVKLFETIDPAANAYFKSVLKGPFEDRKRQLRSGAARKHQDFLDLLLKANEAAEVGKLEASEDDDAAVLGHGPVKSLTDEEILGHAMLIIFAGMETSAGTLQMCLCELALNPDIQDKVYEEIQAVVTSTTPTYEEVNELTYTEQVIHETLRLYSPVPLVTRTAKETKTYEGITIPKGAVVLIPYYHILKDPKHYSDPDKFNPDRFAPEVKDKRDPMTFPPFGQGHRLCPGMRLAMMELKTVLVHILKRMKVVVNDKTEPMIGTERKQIKFKPQGVIIPATPIRLAFEIRDTGNQMVSEI